MARERITSTSSKTKKRHKMFFIKLLWSLLFFVIFLIGLTFVSQIESLAIEDMVVSGNEILGSDEILEKVEGALSENRLLFFSGKNRFIYSKSKIEKKLKSSFPRVLDLDVKLDSRRLVINLSERERAYLWCGEIPPSYENKSAEIDCYFSDKNGFIFDDSPHFSSGVYFTFYSKIQEGDPIGQTILNNELVEDLKLLISSLQEKNFSAHSVVIKDEGQAELLFNISTTSEDYAKLLFTIDQSISEVYNKVISTIEEDPFKSDFSEKPNKLEYIDARFKNRIFYKFAQ